MTRALILALTLVLLGGVAAADESASNGSSESRVPTTVEGGGAKIKEGGKEIGAGFRAVGRGLKDVFTGQRSKEDFEKAKNIGTGARDFGLGTAGVGRGVGRGIKKGFTGDEAGDAPDGRQHSNEPGGQPPLTEEPID